MGISFQTRKLEKQIINDVFDNYKGLCWLELGNQWDYFGRTAKNWYEKQGVKTHASIDINERDGSIFLDLNQKHNTNIKFDVITNYGTLEHVSSQLNGWWNFHNFLKVGGIAIHTLPLIKNYEKHSRYLYSHCFGIVLVLKNRYELMHSQYIGKHPFQGEFISYKKTHDEPFKLPKKLIQDNRMEPARNQEAKFLARPRRVINNLVYPALQKINRILR